VGNSFYTTKPNPGKDGPPSVCHRSDTNCAGYILTASEVLQLLNMPRPVPNN
jgi:hypothetical protein